LPALAAGSFHLGAGQFLGADFDLRHYSRREHDGFIRQRTLGEIDANGRYVADPDTRVRVCPGTAGQDLAVLHAVFNWGMRFRDDNGRLLFKENPMRGLPIPKEKNPKREIATTDRVEAVRENAPKVRMRVEWNGSREYRESFLPEIFDLVVEQGRRIGAVCSLHTKDLRLDRTEDEPYGAIVWPADTDKMGKEWRCPLTERARDAVFGALRKREMVGAGWLFPAAKDKSKPVRIEQAESWLREAEKLAGVEHLDGTCFHAYRRLWATLRKDLPDVDVAQAGGWSSLAALKTAYQRPDAATIRRVVMHQAELRELR
jgi:integrase